MARAEGKADGSIVSILVKKKLAPPAPPKD